MAKCSGGKGESLQLKLKKELNYGVDEASGFYEVARNDVAFEKGVNEITSPTIEKGRSQSKLILGDQDVTGAGEFPLDTDASYLFLDALFGETTTVANGAKYDHTFTTSDKCLGSLQFEETQLDTGLSYKTTGVKVNTMDLMFEREGQVNAKFGLLGDFRYMNKMVVDSVAANTLGADAGINSKTLLLDDVTGYTPGDYILVPFNGGTVNGAHTYTRNIAIVDTSALTKGDFIEIGGVEAQIVLVSSNSIFLNREIDAVDTATVNVLNNEYMVESVDTGAVSITLVKGLVKAMLLGDLLYRKESVSTYLTSEYFDNKRLTIKDNLGNITDADIQKLEFSYSNEQTKEKTISKTRNYDGKTKVELKMDLIVTRENAIMLEQAENGYSFDLVIDLVALNGDTFKLEVFNNELIPGDINLGIPGATKVSIVAKPSKDGAGQFVKATLTNSIASY